MELRVKISHSRNTGCGPSFHWFVWLREDLSRSAGFKLATLPAIMSFKVGELYKKITLLPWLALQRNGTHVQGSRKTRETSSGSTLIWNPPLPIPLTVDDDMLCIKAWVIHKDRQTGMRIELHMSTYTPRPAGTNPTHSPSPPLCKPNTSLLERKCDVWRRTPRCCRRPATEYL